MKKLTMLLLSGLLLCSFFQSLPAGPAEENTVAPGAETAKAKCPKKVSVVLETIKAEPFLEYKYYPLQAQPGTTAVISPADGTLVEVMTGEGAMVFAGQQILAIQTLADEELVKLEEAVASKKKIWTARLNWKEKSARAIEVAEKSYNEAMALLEEKKASSRQTMKAPATGSVHFIQDLGSSVAADAVLLEIVNPGRMIYTLSLSGLENETFSIGQKFAGQAENFQGQAEVIAVNDDRVTFAVDNTGNLLKQDTAFSLKKLKAEYAEAVSVPTQAILHDSLGDYVYLAEKKRAKKVYVTLGAMEAGRTMVEKNLSAGMLLIVSGFECLADKKKVRVVNEMEIAGQQAQAELKAKQAVDAEAVAMKKEDERKAKVQAALEAKQAKEKAAAERKAKKEQEKQNKAVAKASACPKKVSVLTEITKQETFSEYGYYSAPTKPEAVKVVSPEAGWIFSLRVGEGAQVEQGGELLTLIAGDSEMIAKLRLEVAKKMNVLLNRQEAKVKNEKAVQAAERDLQKSISQLELEVAPYARMVQSPVSGVVQNLKVVTGADVSAADVLLEIMTESQLLVTIPLSAPESARFALEETVSGMVEGQDATWNAQVTAVSDTQVTLRVDNAGRQIKTGIRFTVRKLKAEHAAAVVVPTTALAKDSLGDYIYMVEKKKAKKKYVAIGASEAGRTMVKKGLAAGVPIVVSDLDCLADRKKVRVINEKQMTEQEDKKAATAGKTAAQLRGIEEFIAHLEANRDTLQYERYEQTEIKKHPVLKVFSGLETQKKLIDLITQYAVKQISFAIEDEQVVSTIIFKYRKQVAAKDEKPIVGEKVRLFGERLRFAVHGTYYMMLDQNFKDAYVALNGFGGSLAFRFASKMDFWVSGGLAAKNNTPDWSPVELKFRITPLAAALRYYFLEKGKLSAFAGAGANVFLVKDFNPVEDIKTTLIGFNALAGGYYQLSRKVFAQLFLKFNVVQKDLYPDSTLDDPLNLSGLELNLGFGILL